MATIRHHERDYGQARDIFGLLARKVNEAEVPGTYRPCAVALW